MADRPTHPDGEPVGPTLVELLGRPLDDPAVQGALALWAHGMQPELDAEDPDALADWVTVNERGLEFGFEDQANLLAMDPALRRDGPLILSQVCFFGETPRTQPFGGLLPFGLDWQMDAGAVRLRMSELDEVRRSYRRDVWCAAAFDMVAAYGAEGQLESLLFALRPRPWPVPPDEPLRVEPFTPARLVSLFGERWSSPRLRESLQPLGFAQALADVRSERSADLSRLHGIEFGFAPPAEVSAASASVHPASTLVLASVTYYGPRVRDAMAWQGSLPERLDFDDSQHAIAAKVGRVPDERGDDTWSGFALWHRSSDSLRVEFSNIENRLLRVTLMAPGYWEASGAAAGADPIDAEDGDDIDVPVDDDRIG